MLAVMASPIGVRFVTGRLDLSPRITVLSLTFSAFLLVLAAAVPSRRRMRVIIFYLLMFSFPLVLLSVIETAAIAFHLADRFAPLQDMSTLVNRSGWPPDLMSAGRKVEQDGLQLYRPRQGPEIVINEQFRLANCAAHTKTKWGMADRDHRRFGGIWLAHA